jgi:glycosyltransferase involved in cell wall biosynthesis
MLRILVLINGWRNRTIRGGDYHVLRVLKNWNKENRISIIMPRLGYESAKTISPDWDSIYLSSKGCKDVESLPALVGSYLLRIIRSLFFVNTQEHHVIIASSHLLYDILPAVFLRRRLKSKLVVYVFHIFRTFRTYKEGVWSTISLLSEKTSLFLCRKADLIFVDNHEIKDALIGKGFRTDRIFVTANGVEHEFIDSVKGKFKEFDGCFCGSLDKRKGIYDLLYVWEKILTSFPKSRLAIIGQGPEYPNLLRTIREKRLEENIYLTGYLSEEQKISTMKSSKLFIFPSIEEGWGIAVSEAMACGLAVVCYDLEAYKAFGAGIIRVRVRDKETMAKAVQDLLVDKNKREDAGLKAIEAARRLNWDTIASDELEEIKKRSII